MKLHALKYENNHYVRDADTNTVICLRGRDNTISTSQHWTREDTNLCTEIPLIEARKLFKKATTDELRGYKPAVDVLLTLFNGKIQHTNRDANGRFIKQKHPNDLIREEMHADLNKFGFDAWSGSPARDVATEIVDLLILAGYRKQK